MKSVPVKACIAGRASIMCDSITQMMDTISMKCRVLELLEPASIHTLGFLVKWDMWYTNSTKMSVSFTLTTLWVSGFSLSTLFTWNITRVSASSCLHCNCTDSRTTDPFSTVYLWSSNAKYRECPDKIWAHSGRSHSQKKNLSNADLNDGDSNAFCYSVGRLLCVSEWPSGNGQGFQNSLFCTPHTTGCPCTG